MRQWIIITLAVFTFSSLALAQSDSKAEQIMNQARAAISNEAQTKTLKTLSVAMTIHRTIGETHLERDIDYDIILPDTFRRHESQQPFTTVTSMLDDSYQTYNVPNPAAHAGDHTAADGDVLLKGVRRRDTAAAAARPPRRRSPRRRAQFRGGHRHHLRVAEHLGRPAADCRHPRGQTPVFPVRRCQRTRPRGLGSDSTDEPALRLRQLRPARDARRSRRRDRAVFRDCA